MATASLNASARSGTGTGVARKLRQAGNVPAIVYGHGREPQPITVNAREVDKLLATVSAASTVIELSIDGKTSRTLIREIQRHPVRRSFVHIDFQELVAGEKVTVSIPLRFTGTADGVRHGGGILEETMHQVHLRVDPASIPNHLEVDVTPLTIGHSLHIRDLVVPDGATILDEPGATICVVSAPKAAEETTPAAAAGAEGATPAAEPELIRKAKAEGEGEGE